MVSLATVQGATYDNVQGGPPGGKAQWKMVFEDNFDGSAVDAKKWNTSWRGDNAPSGGRYWMGKQDSYYGDGNIQVKSGNMELITRRESPAVSPLSKYTTGVLQSLSKYEFTFGYMEARVKVPAGKGLWGAFWAISTVMYDWPPEIDVFEDPYPDWNNSCMYQTWHPVGTDQVQRIVKSTEDPWNISGTEWGKTDGAGWTGDYHIYASNWTAESLYFYIDNVQTMATKVGVADIKNRKMYLLFDMITVGGWGNPVDETTPLPATMYTDWVRVWQKGATGISGRPASLRNRTLTCGYNVLRRTLDIQGLAGHSRTLVRVHDITGRMMFSRNVDNTH